MIKAWRWGGAKLLTYILAAVILLLVSSVGLNLFLVRSDSSKVSTKSDSVMDYPLLAKRIFVDDPNDTILNFAPLRQELRRFFDSQDVNFSFYAEYLPTGTSIKINQDNQMVGASLLKIPVVMNLFRAIERGEADSSDIVTIKEGDIDKRSGTLWQKGVGAKLTLKETARYAIVESDNTAVNMLIGAASGKFDLFQEAIDELDINLSVENDAQSTIGAQGYSSLLKCLYLSCFNDYADSQQILAWMAQSHGPLRLRFDLPEGLTVAHKYGTSGGRSESDCGVVYVPKRSYIICVMVDVPPEQANPLIAEVSRKVYDYVSGVEN